MNDYSSLLNEQQLEAVVYNDGPSVIVAGAGSGKTRVLTYKIAYLIENGLAPYHILALTFTNKAAREMKERIAEVVGEEKAHQLWMGTFHSMFFRILRQESQVLGYNPSSLTIYDTTDSKSLLRSIVKELALDDKTYAPKLLMNKISYAKNHLISSASYASSSDLKKVDDKDSVGSFSQIYTEYEVRLKRSNAMDFDDLLFKTSQLFTAFPEVLKKYQEKFQFLLVDEYQDTNKVQHHIMAQLAKLHKHIAVVGDDAQSIYAFRGANVDNMILFNQTYPEARTFKLERNYRSTQTIVNAANSIISHNTHRIKKNVYSELLEGDKLNYYVVNKDKEEPLYVVRAIKRWKNKGLDYNDIAILYRTNAQSRIFEGTLRSAKIPYRIYGGLSFYQRKEIKDTLAYLRLILNPSDEEAWRRVVNYPARKIGVKSQNLVLDAAHQNELNVMAVLSNIEHYIPDVKNATIKKMTGFYDLIYGLHEIAEKKNAYEVVEAVVLQTGLLQEITSDESIEGIAKQQNLEEFLNAVATFVRERQDEGNEDLSIYAFMNEVQLLTDQDTDQNETQNKVTLMTIHASKGLEFRAIAIVGLEEGLFPSLKTESPKELEEERRLFYVAVTRAKDYCMLSSSLMRWRYGNQEWSTPSRFMKEIDAQYLEKHKPKEKTQTTNDNNGGWGNRSANSTPRKSYGDAYRQPYNQKKDPASMVQIEHKTEEVTHEAVGEWSVGDKVVHATFGSGAIEALIGEEPNLKAKINFKKFGEKQLLMKFARLTKQE